MVDSIYTIKAGTLANGGSIALTMRNFVRKSNGDLAVCYVRSDGSYNQIYVSESTDDGVNWSETALTSYGASKSVPTLAVDDHDRLYCFYSGKDSAGGYSGDTQVRMKPDGGSWTSAVVIATYTIGSGCGIGICDSGGRMWAAAIRHSTQVLRVYYSDDHGASWTWHTGANLDDIVYFDQQCPIIHISPVDGYPAVLYQKIDGVRIWKYRKWDGANWSVAANKTDAGANSAAADFIFNSDGKLHVVESNGLTPYIKYSYDGGAFVQLSSNHTSYFPKLVKNVNGDLYCFWYGYSAADGSNRHLHYRKSTDNGANWAAQVTLTSGAYQNRYPHCVYMEYPRTGSVFTEKPKIGYAIYWVVDTDLKIRLSSDLTWDSASTQYKDFTDVGAGVDTPQADKECIISDSGSGADAYLKHLEIDFADVAAGSDDYKQYHLLEFDEVAAGSEEVETHKTLLYFDTGNGVEAFLADKELFIYESALGSDLFLRDKNDAGFYDDAYGTERFHSQYPYPKDLKRMIIKVRDRK